MKSKMYTSPNYYIYGASAISNKSDELVREQMNNPKRSLYNKYGYMLFGPLLYSFCKWIHDYCDKNKIESIFFIARDGYVIKKAWEKLFGNDYKTAYLYCSRSSVLDARIEKNMTLESLFNNITDKKLIALKGIIGALNLPDEDVQKLKEKYDVCDDEMISLESLHDETKKPFFDDILELVKEKNNNRNTAFKSYIKNELWGENRIAIVDVGWRGTIQQGIEIALDNMGMRVEVHGLYLGIYGDKQGKRDIRKTCGYLYNAEGTKQLKRIKPARGLIEFFFSAPHGKTKYFENNGDVSIPVMAENEYDREFGTNNIEIKSLEELQKGALEYVEMIESVNDDCSIMSNVEAFRPLYVYSVNPKYEDIYAFGDLHFCSDTMERIAKPKPLFYYLRHFNRLKNDFAKSVWKIGYMKRLLHGVPFPYRQIFNCLLQINGLV